MSLDEPMKTDSMTNLRSVGLRFLDPSVFRDMHGFGSRFFKCVQKRGWAGVGEDRGFQGFRFAALWRLLRLGTAVKAQ